MIERQPVGPIGPRPNLLRFVRTTDLDQPLLQIQMLVLCFVKDLLLSVTVQLGSLICCLIFNQHCQNDSLTGGAFGC